MCRIPSEVLYFKHTPTTTPSGCPRRKRQLPALRRCCRAAKAHRVLRCAADGPRAARPCVRAGVFSAVHVRHASARAAPGQARSEAPRKVRESARALPTLRAPLLRAQDNEGTRRLSSTTAWQHALAGARARALPARSRAPRTARSHRSHLLLRARQQQILRTRAGARIDEPSATPTDADSRCAAAATRAALARAVARRAAPPQGVLPAWCICCSPALHLPFNRPR